MLPGQLDMFGGATLPTIEAKPAKARKAKAKGLVERVVEATVNVTNATAETIREIRAATAKRDAEFLEGVEYQEVVEARPIPRRRSVAPGGTLEDAGDATMDYLHGQLAASFQASVGDDPKLATALLVASTLSHRGPVPSLPISGIMLDSEDRTSAPCMIVEDHRYEANQILASIGVSPFTAPAKAIPLLMGLDRSKLDVLLAHFVARSAVIGWGQSGADLLRASGKRPLDDWRIEPSYLKTLSTGQVRALAEEILPIDDLPSRSASRERIEKAIMDAVIEDGFDWSPPQLQEIE